MNKIGHVNHSDEEEVAVGAEPGVRVNWPEWDTEEEDDESKEDLILERGCS